MTTMTFPAYSYGGAPGGRLGKVAVILALHAGLFFLIKNGMLHRAVQQLPEVVNVSFVTPPAPPAPPAPPKTVEVAHKVPNVVTPPLPRTTLVSLPALLFTESVRSFQVPATPFTCA